MIAPSVLAPLRSSPFNSACCTLLACSLSLAVGWVPSRDGPPSLQASCTEPVTISPVVSACCDSLPPAFNIVGCLAAWIIKTCNMKARIGLPEEQGALSCGAAPGQVAAPVAGTSCWHPVCQPLLEKARPRPSWDLHSFLQLCSGAVSVSDGSVHTVPRGVTVGRCGGGRQAHTGGCRGREDRGAALSWPPTCNSDINGQTVDYEIFHHFSCAPAVAAAAPGWRRWKENARRRHVCLCEPP